jgi:hypothetical protein
MKKKGTISKKNLKKLEIYFEKIKNADTKQFNNKPK